MEREIWNALRSAIAAVDSSFADNPHYAHRTAKIASVYLWAALHERCIDWACQSRHWYLGAPERHSGALPDQSTMSRRTRQRDGRLFHEFLDRLAAHLSKHPDLQRLDLKRLDGKPLLVAAHSKDRNATWGRGAGGLQRGYKLHALWGSSILPERFCVTPMHVGEAPMAARQLRRLEGAGYVVADGNYDSNELFGWAHLEQYQLLAPRRATAKGLGHRKHRAARLRSVQLLESRRFGLGDFGPKLHKERRDIERRFGNVCGGVGGMSTYLPHFIRRIWRVRAWVKAKLLIYAARCTANTKQDATAA